MRGRDGGGVKMEPLTNKLKILKNPTKKSARDLLKAINKPGYEVSIKNRGNDTEVRIDKKNVPLSLNDKKTRLLFICTSAMDRSPCAANLFRFSKEYEAKFAGISQGSEVILTKEAISWADVIFTMEPEHQRYVLEKFPMEIKAGKKKVILLDIPNCYKRHDRALEELLVIKLQEEGFM